MSDDELVWGSDKAKPEITHEQQEKASQETTGEKLQKVLARVGLGSRRELERHIAEGRVTVNGRVAKLGDRVEPSDSIEHDGKKVSHADSGEQIRILLYNKPEGEICTQSDPEGRRTVFESLPRLNNGRWIQVGRLDINTSGLLLFTNHGELANKLMHPSSNIDREYLVRVRGQLTDEIRQTLLNGVVLEDGPAKFTDIEESPNNEEGQTHQWYYCAVMEGRNREVRRLWESQDLQVNRLKRVRFGNVFIPSHVRVGQWVEMTFKEVRDICTMAGMASPKKRRFQQKVEDQRQRHLKKLRASNKHRRRT